MNWPNYAHGLDFSFAGLVTLVSGATAVLGMGARYLRPLA